MKNEKPKTAHDSKAFVSLLFLAIAAAFAWRLEIELRGWDGLQWLGYFHISVPFGIGAFLSWVALFSRNEGWKPVIAAALWATLSSYILAVAAYFYFIEGPRALALVLQWGESGFRRFLVARTIVMPILWISAAVVIYRIYGNWYRISRITWLTGIGLWMGSWPLGLAIISIIPERGSADLIHALKTGWIIPFLVIAAGLPVAIAPNRKNA